MWNLLSRLVTDTWKVVKWVRCKGEGGEREVEVMEKTNVSIF